MGVHASEKKGSLRLEPGVHDRVSVATWVEKGGEEDEIDCKISLLRASLAERPSA